MIFAVIVKPNSKKAPQVMQSGNELTVFLREKPVDGEANSALIKLLAKYFNVSRNSIVIKTGARARKKLVEVNL